MSLDRVAAAIGYHRDSPEPARWKFDALVVTIDGTKFFDHLRGTRGGGAIDLFVPAIGCRLPGAIRLFASKAAQRRAAEIQPAAPHLRLLSSNPRTWPQVREALVRQRALPSNALKD